MAVDVMIEAKGKEKANVLAYELLADDLARGYIAVNELELCEGIPPLITRVRVLGEEGGQNDGEQ
jgi:hypothetical protein